MTARHVWITVSHPGMSLADDIGDMVRLRTMAAALRTAGCEVELITWKDRAGRRSARPGHGRDNGHSIVSSVKRCLKAIVPQNAWSTSKDLSYQRLNEAFYELLVSRSGPRPQFIIDYNFYFNDAALRFARQIGARLFLNFEGFVFDTMVGPPRSWLRSVGERFEFQKYATVDGILAVSQPLKAMLIERLGAQAPPIHVIPNAVELPQGRLPVREQPRGIPVVGFVGGLSPWYALDRLIEACERIRRRGIECRLILIGDGPQRGMLEELISRLNARSWCELTGLVPHDRVAERVAEFDIGVITNHQWWTSPLKLLEYGAQAVAVVAPAKQSITSMVRPDEVALFEPERWDSFEAVVAELLSDAGRRRTIGQRLCRRVAADYSLAAMVQRLVQAMGLPQPIPGKAECA